jgi:hypothetical protein
VRILCSRFSVTVAFGLLSICVGGLSGCDSKPADGTLVEAPQIDADQKAEVKAQYQRQSQRQGNSSTKGNTPRRKF